MEEQNKPKRKVIGVVVGKKMQKTATVVIERLVQHPVYKKIQRRTTRLHVHDENDQCKVGDKVAIMQSRPISKLKSWTLSEVLEKQP
jgi:small subunit ribosomal protein S17